MKQHQLKLFILSSIILGLLFNSCGPKSFSGRVGESNKTGWKFNDEEFGSFEVVEYVEQQTGPDLVLIEGGTFTMGNSQQRVMDNWNAIKRRVTVSSYYMDQHEVSNLNYLEYLHWLRKVFSTNPSVVEKALPDTNVWRRPLAFNEPFVKYYLRHPAYQDYPVVGVSWVQANEYALWRTDRVNEKILYENGIIDQLSTSEGQVFTTDGYLADPTAAGGEGVKSLVGNGTRPVRFEDGFILPNYRLPTEAEWEYAALGLKSDFERISNYKMYPWEGYVLRNNGFDNPADGGLFMANFVRGRGDYMGVAGYLNDGGAPTVPVDAYWPNDFGLYCMAGNVNEWVLDVYRPMSSVDMDEFNPFRGNIFTTEFIKDGKPDIDSMGHVKRRMVGTNKIINPVTGEVLDSTTSTISDEKLKKEVFRYNYRTADNRNYMDGDLQSSIGPNWLPGEADYKGTNDMYVYHVGEAGGNPTSLITDEVRVYKGGSWRDRAYWLSPGTRRFLDQNMSRDDLGFRCAMLRVGSPAGHK